MRAAQRRAIVEAFMADPLGTVERAMAADFARAMAAHDRAQALGAAFDGRPVPAGKRLLVRVGRGWILGAVFADGDGYRVKAVRMTSDRDLALTMAPAAAQALGRQYAAAGHDVALEAVR